MSWYKFVKSGWAIAVDAIDSGDAASTVYRQAPGAHLVGPINPERTDNDHGDRIIVSDRRRAQIEARQQRDAR